jgi:hypothetical protein
MHANAIHVNQVIQYKNKNYGDCLLMCEMFVAKPLVKYIVHPLMYAYRLLNLYLCENFCATSW